MFATVAALAWIAALLLVLLVNDRSRAEPIRLAQLRQLLANVPAMYGLAITLLGMAALFTTYTMITPILRDRFAAGPAAISFALLLYGIAGVAGNRLARHIALIWLSEKSIAVSLLLLIGGFVVLYFAPAWFAMALLALIPWAIGVDIFAPGQQRRIVELVPEMRGLVLALNSSSLFGGMALGGYIAGKVVPVFGLMALPVVSIALAVLSLLLLRASMRGDRKVGALVA
jgi:DHA1 family inner membrane transport protein